MRYSLVVYSNNEVFEVKGFSEIAKYETDESSLEDIVAFMSEFESEEDLMETLLMCNLIPKNFCTAKPLIFFYPSKTKNPKVLPYGVSYKQDEKYYSKEYLINYYLSHMTNEKFMEVFLDIYLEKLQNVNHFSSHLFHLNQGFKEYKITKYFRSEYNDDMRTFINKYIKTQQKDGSSKISFTRLRELAMLAVCYENKYNREKPHNKFRDKDYWLFLKRELQRCKELIRRDDIDEEERSAHLYKIGEIEKEFEQIDEKVLKLK